MHEQQPDEPVDPAFAQAYARVAELFLAARAFVFDRYPHGMPERQHLPPAHRKRLEDLEQAEEHLDELRRQRRARRRAGCEH